MEEACLSVDGLPVSMCTFYRCEFWNGMLPTCSDAMNKYQCDNRERENEPDGSHCEKSPTRVKLLHIEAYREQKKTKYCLKFSSSVGEWTISKVYKDFLKCHTRLLKVFKREDLPTFPPKVSIFQRMLHSSSAHQDWEANQTLHLKYYVESLLRQQELFQTGACRQFFLCPSETPLCNSQRNLPAEITSIRARLAGDSGNIEIIICASKKSKANRVQLSCQRITDKGREEGISGGKISELGDHELELELPSVVEGETCEVVHKFMFEPSTSWEVTACGLSCDNVSGVPVCIQFQVPQRVDPNACKRSQHYFKPGALAQKLSRHAPLGWREVDKTEVAADVSSIRPTTVSGEEDATQDCARSPLSLWKGKKVEGEAIRKNVTYKGSAASAYAQAIKKSHERNCMVKTLTDAGTHVTTLTRQPSSCGLQKYRNSSFDRMEKQLTQLQKDARRVAEWIESVRGCPISKVPSPGPEELQVALQSGEVLCDLVNTIWRSQIVGISQCKLNSIRQLENITRFIHACRDLGVEEARLFLPSDLVEGKNLRNVFLCILALADLVPNLPLRSRDPSLKGSCRSRRNVTPSDGLTRMTERSTDANPPPNANPSGDANPSVDVNPSADGNPPADGNPSTKTKVDHIVGEDPRDDVSSTNQRSAKMSPNTLAMRVAAARACFDAPKRDVRTTSCTPIMPKARKLTPS